MKQIAGTIMLFDDNGEPNFLVTEKADRYHLLLTTQEAHKTPLASILGMLKWQLGVDVTMLRLSELSNVIIRGNDVSLFVFKWGKLTPQQLADNIEKLRQAGYTFERPKKLRGLLAEIDMSGVPHFD